MLPVGISEDKSIIDDGELQNALIAPLRHTQPKSVPLAFTRPASYLQIVTSPHDADDDDVLTVPDAFNLTTPVLRLRSMTRENPLFGVTQRQNRQVHLELLFVQFCPLLILILEVQVPILMRSRIGSGRCS